MAFSIIHSTTASKFKNLLFSLFITLQGQGITTTENMEILSLMQLIKKTVFVSITRWSMRNVEKFTKSSLKSARNKLNSKLKMAIKLQQVLIQKVKI